MGPFHQQGDPEGCKVLYLCFHSLLVTTNVKLVTSLAIGVMPTAPRSDALRSRILNFDCSERLDTLITVKFLEISRGESWAEG
jgi:hypothetical protein